MSQVEVMNHRGVRFKRKTHYHTPGAMLWSQLRRRIGARFEELAIKRGGHFGKLQKRFWYGLWSRLDNNLTFRLGYELVGRLKS